MLRQTLGCSALIALPSFCVGVVVAFTVMEASLAHRLAVGAMVGAMAFVASLFLFIRDRDRWTANRVGVQHWLATREDTSEDQFLASIEPEDWNVALHVRRRLAEFFEVSPDKIQSDDEWKAFESFMPGIYLFVVSGLVSRQPSRQIEAFPKSKMTKVADLVAEVKLLRNPP